MGFARIRNRAIADGRTQTAGLILLFESSGRPDRAAVRSALGQIGNASISFDPGERSAGGGTTGTGDTDAWLEILVDGLTFDLVGLAPGPRISVPAAEFRIDFPAGLDVGDFEAVSIAPGPHLSGGHRSLVVARAMAGLACGLARSLDKVAAFYWLPSRCVTGTDFFISTVQAWIEGGPFPALGMTTFAETSDNGLRSVGLSFFTGQEIEIPQEIAEDPAARTRIAMRLVHQLALHGELTEPQTITGPDGRMLELMPDAGGKLVQVRHG